MQLYVFRISLVVLAMMLSGCDTGPRMDYSSVGLIDAEGTVTLDGEPLANAVVTFESPDGTFSYAMTDDSGHYEMQFDSEIQGVTPGVKVVRISTTRKILGLNAEEAEVGEESTEQATAPVSDAERVPPKYNEKSELTVEVTPDQTEYDFALAS